jgi:cob(I)alamin adenosyltransferase
MSIKDMQQKDSVVVVYTGEGKGKTSASLGLMARALGAEWKVAYVQFIKAWEVNEHKFIQKILPLYDGQLTFKKGGAGFYNAGELSSKASEEEHRAHAAETYDFAYACATSGDYSLVICDEINNAVHDGLLTQKQLETLIAKKHPATSLCLTGRHFPEKLLDRVDIATNMTKLRHHYDDGFVANNGIDY